MKPARPFRTTLSLLLIAGSALSSAVSPLRAQAPAATQAATSAPAQPEAKAPKLTPKQIREAEITAESEQLLRLALELKVEVDKSNKDTMSLSVIKKAAEVEKLANTLRLHLLVD